MQAILGFANGDFLGAYKFVSWERAMFVRKILRMKGFDVFSVVPDETVRGVVRIFGERKIGFAIVGDPKGEVIGTISERDVCHAVCAKGEGAVTMLVRDIMTRNVVSCALHDTLPKVMALMTERRTRHILVMEGGAIKGVVSGGDLLKHRLDEVLRQEKSMRDFIAGSDYSVHS